MERNAEASADRNRSSFLGNLNDMVANSVENQLARGVEAEFAQSSQAACSTMTTLDISISCSSGMDGMD